MKILITGADGYLGRELTRWILKHTNHRLILLNRSWEAASVPDHHRVTKITFTLDQLAPDTDIGAAAQSDMVIHLAAKVLHSFQTSATELLEQNLLNTTRLLEWMAHHKIGKFIFASSMTVYAKGPGSPVPETFSRRPYNWYGFSKYCAEDAIRQFTRQSAVKAIILRLPGLFGGGRKGGLLFHAAQKMKENLTLELNFQNLGNWEVLWIHDAVSILGGIVEKNSFNVPCRIFNVGYGDSTVKLRNILKQIKEYYGSKSAVEILYQKDYQPFVMRTSRIRSFLGRYPYRFQGSLEGFLRELEA